MEKYNPNEIEKKWQERWEKQGIYATPSEDKNKRYILDMFPYPSGATMHVGHLEGYVGTDIIARYERMGGNAVLHPMGWDSFGLPAENYAIETKIHPYQSTHKNIKTFKRQLNSTGLSYDWSREIDTSSPEFYKWTQWLFILMYKRGLAYKKMADVNWCPSCETVLANEQVLDGKCDRCGTEVVQKELEQWFLKITEYADRLISGLDEIDWLEEVKIQQKNWIGRSEGTLIEFKVKSSKLKIEVFTTRGDTLYGATFIVLAPEHPIVASLLSAKFKVQSSKLKEIKDYVEGARKKTKQDRIAEGKEKTGVFSGLYAINPLNEEKLPVWIADYAVMEFGTGALFGDAHDERDVVFAKKYGIPLKATIITGDKKKDERIMNLEECYTGYGTLVDSGEFSGLKSKEAMKKVTEWLAKRGKGGKKVTYHLRDWLISRQRYWGAPIPMIFCKKCDWQPVDASDLPVELPKDVDFRPTGQSPIARSKSFQKNVVCPNCKGRARREVDTMDTYVDSSWYFIRFIDSNNDKKFASQKAIKDWLPVDVYVGGGHVVQHLLFARFFWKVLFDAGLIDKSLGDEPFLKLRAPGWILGPDWRKMSKRWNNVITPDDVIPKYGADAMRMYEMFMGPFESMKPWSITGVEGVSRFIKKVWRLFEETGADMAAGKQDKEVALLLNRLVKRVGEDIESMNFNTAISSMMEVYNSLIEMKRRGVRIGWREVWEKFLLVLAPFAPYVTEELWSRMGHSNSIHLESWPTYDPKMVEEEFVTVAVQVDGKLRDTVRVESAISNLKSQIEKRAKENSKVNKYIKNGTKKVVFVPGKIINFVTT